MGEQRRLHHAGSNDDHAHIASGNLLAHTLRDGVDGILGAAVDRVVIKCLSAGNGADVDDGPLIACHHIRKHGLCPGENALDVHIDHAAPFLEVLPVRMPQQHQAGAVDEQIGLAVDGLGFTDRSLHGSRVCDIHAPAKTVGQLKRLHYLLSPGQHQNRMPLPGKTLGKFHTDSGACSGDHN